MSVTKAVARELMIEFIKSNPQIRKQVSSTKITCVFTKARWISWLMQDQVLGRVCQMSFGSDDNEIRTKGICLNVFHAMYTGGWIRLENHTRCPASNQLKTTPTTATYSYTCCKSTFDPFRTQQYVSARLDDHALTLEAYQHLKNNARLQPEESKYEGEFEPFKRMDPNPGVYEMTKVALSLGTIIPLRVCALILLNAFYFASVGVLRLLHIITGFNLCRDIACKITQGSARVLLFIVGFYKIDSKRRKDTRKSCAQFLICNHSSILDYIVVIATQDNPTFAYTQTGGPFDVPVFGLLLQFALGSRKNRPILFPEGTSSNGHFLLPFHPAAFELGQPCQPLILRYPFVYFSPTYESIYMVAFTLRLLSQVFNSVEVEELEVYRPSLSEQINPELYAENIRTNVATKAAMKITGSSFPEKLAYHYHLRREFETHAFGPVAKLVSVDPFLQNQTRVQNVNLHDPIVIYDIKYCQEQHCSDDKHKLDIYLPPHSMKGTEELPNPMPKVIVFVHGGGWQRGDRRASKYFSSLQDINWLMYFFHKHIFNCYSNIGLSLAKAGYACIIPSYRLSSLRCPYFVVEIFCSAVSSFGVIQLVSVVVFQFLPTQFSQEQIYELKHLSWARYLLTGFAVWALIWGQLYESTSRLYESSSNRLRPWTYAMICALALQVFFWSSATAAATYCAILITLVGTLLHTVTLIYNNLTSPVKHPAHVLDVAKALRWTVDHAMEFHYDASSLLLMGHSAGAHISSLVALDGTYLEQVGLSPSIISGVVGLSGVYDLIRLNKKKVTSKLYVEPSFWEYDIEVASPISHVSSAAPPFLLINAESDAGLEEDSENFRQALKNAGARNPPESVIVIEGTNHLSLITSIQDHLPGEERNLVMQYCDNFISSIAMPNNSLPRELKKTKKLN